MPGPSTTFLEAVRAGAAGRHIFFRLEHSQGTVLAWDGVGEFVFNSETYTGIGGFASVAGVSNSGDIQNHVIEVRLNAVPLTAIRDIDPAVKGNAASLYAVWISETGSVVYSKTLFSGQGNNLKVVTGDKEMSLICRLSGMVADWSFVPRSYYTGQDQKRLFSGDTGCDQTSSLENAIISGWLPGPNDGSPYIFMLQATRTGTAPLKPDFIARPGDNRLIGSNTLGPNTRRQSEDEWAISQSGSPEYYFYQDIVTGQTLTGASIGAPIQIDGVSCSIDDSGNVISPAGNYIAPSNNLTSGYRLRIAGDVASTGTANGNEVKAVSIGSFSHFCDETALSSGANFSGMIFMQGAAEFPVIGPGSLGTVSGHNISPVQDNVNGVEYIEWGSAWQIIFSQLDGYVYARSGSGVLGTRVQMTNTGAVVGPNGGRIVTRNRSDDSKFWRRWT